MPYPVDGGGAEDAIGEGIGPLGQVQVGSDDGALSFIAFRDEIVQVLILRAFERF